MNKIDLRKNIKRKKLLQAAAKVISTKGYNDSSIKDITEKAQISVGSFYSYFSNKEDVLLALYDEIANMHFEMAKIVSSNCEVTGAKRLACIISSLVYVQAKNPELVLILLLKTISINERFENKHKEIINTIKNVVMPIFEGMKKNNLIEIIDVEVAAISFIYSINGVMLSYIMDENKKDIEDVAFNIAIYNLNALKMKFDIEEIQIYIRNLYKKNYFEKFINEVCE
ncbi:TetR/AcrR family transcriptional regulator [Clostridium uliginosum]|uniref:DNA-binding transcriptional regulator, AcrR family n=1 Tax=Clostridium uliginosum TaxID=119641 RepID=A0A1I1SHH4_9CLOT|nr:TetR/AcrR family transcriptional regulator [Clostridium uliginosum]SFD45939.1 DNA-binding transcriptional regulator, AcrR family [Clostridium uliginosum]